MKVILLSIIVIGMIGLMIPSVFADKLQEKFDEYWSCGIGTSVSDDCIPTDEEKHTIGVQSKK